MVKLIVPEGEPPTEDWTAVDVGSIVDGLPVPPPGRPLIIAVDGRSASGKSTLADTLAAAIPRSCVVHTDDLAWQESFFGWDHLLREVLTPLHRGEPVVFRPPAWELHGRDGAITVSDDCRVVLVEGVGAGRREVADLVDHVIWVQSDFAEAERRGIARDVAHGMNGDAAASTTFWHEWMAQELSFLRDDRPWTRADLMVAGAAPIPLQKGQLAVAAGPGAKLTRCAVPAS